MRTLALFLSLVTLSACGSDDAAVGPPPEAPRSDEPSIPDVEPDLSPDAAEPTAEAPDEPTHTTAPPPPLAPVEPDPAAPAPLDHPEGEHTMDDGTPMRGDMPMDGEHTMGDGTPMNHDGHAGGHDG